MALISEKIDKDKIKHQYASNNLKTAEYDIKTKELVVEFKKGGKYSYKDVPLKEIVSLKRATSHGSHFSKNIAKNYKYKKLS